MTEVDQYFAVRNACGNAPNVIDFDEERIRAALNGGGVFLYHQFNNPLDISLSEDGSFKFEPNILITRGDQVSGEYIITRRGKGGPSAAELVAGGNIERLGDEQSALDYISELMTEGYEVFLETCEITNEVLNGENFVLIGIDPAYYGIVIDGADMTGGTLDDLIGNRTDLLSHFYVLDFTDYQRLYSNIPIDPNATDNILQIGQRVDDLGTIINYAGETVTVLVPLSSRDNDQFDKLTMFYEMYNGTGIFSGELFTPMTELRESEESTVYGDFSEPFESL